MARKSIQLRLSQTRDLITAYEKAGLGDDKACHFAKDMEYRLARNKGLTSKRRQWLDSLIEDGVPPAQNEERVNKIIAAANLRGMEQKHRFLMSFAVQLRKGWALSEKQEHWLGEMMAQADKIQQEGLWSPDEELAEKMRLAIDIGSSKNGWYWQHRPGTAKAHDKVLQWLADPENVVVEEWACNKLLSAYKKTFSELENPRHPVGAMCYYEGNAGIITGAPYITKRGKLVYPVLVAGNDVEIESSNITKRKVKRK